MPKDSMFIPGGSDSGGGSGSTTTIINNLTSTSVSAALSANMGRVLNEKIIEHEQLIAGVGVSGELGHVKVDGSTIKIDPTTGIISSTASGGDSVTHAQAILPTTVADQQTWNIPFSNYTYPDDLLIVTHNSTVVDTNGYTITQNIDDVSWDVNIPMNPLYPRPIADNNVFVIMIKGMGTGGGTNVIVEDILTSTSTVNALSANMGRALKALLDDHEKVEASKTVLGHVKIDDLTIKVNQDGEIYVDVPSESNTKLESYQYVLPTTTVGQTEWEIPLASFDKDSDTILVSHNTTLLTNEMYELSTVAGKHYVKITESLPSEIAKNNVFIVILKNVISDGTSMISGSILIDGTVTEDKLSQDVQDKLNSSGSPQWGTF